jgi:hypothetical protein
METGWGHLGRSVKHSEGKGGKSVVSISRFLYCSPHLCQLRTKGLVPISKYWMYRLHTSVYRHSKPSSLSSTENGFTPTASMATLGEKLGTNTRIGQPTCCGLCREPFFSGVVALSIAIDDFVKGCHVRGLPTGSVRGAYVDWCGKRTCRVDRFSPAGCTSIWIVVTLKYE